MRSPYWRKPNKGEETENRGAVEEEGDDREKVIERERREREKRESRGRKSTLDRTVTVHCQDHKSRLHVLAPDTVVKPPTRNLSTWDFARPKSKTFSGCLA